MDECGRVLDEKRHSKCDFTPVMKLQLDIVYKTIESPVLEPQVLHMDKQWAKGNTEA